MLTNLTQLRSSFYTAIIFTLFLLFSVVQTALFGSATTSITGLPCSSVLHIMFSVMTVGEASLVLYCILALIAVLTKKFYFIPMIIGSLTFLYKIGLVIYIALKASKILGNCYLNDTLKQVIYSSFCLEAILIIVSLCMLGRTSVLNRQHVLSSFSVTRNYTME